MAKKNVVSVESNTTNKASQPANQSGQPNQPTWTPTPESKQQATTFRIIAAVLWVLAIAGEVFAIFRLLRQNPVNFPLLIGAIVVIGVLAVGGDLLWKRANKLDPASTSEPVRFFIQNQLGAILAIVAFLPLIVMIFLNKNMDSKQKGIAGAIGVVALAVASIMGISFNPPSVEQYTQTSAPQLSQTALPQFPAESAVVAGYMGKDLVFWTKDGGVYHLCQAVSDLQHESKDNTIYSGTVADAHAAGKDRLTLKVPEELKQCGIDTPLAPSPTPGR
jgi:Na+/melibiose symporter-like transporter